ncbi:hypothetical protein ACFXTH_028283 [Malus domestica]
MRPMWHLGGGISQEVIEMLRVLPGVEEKMSILVIFQILCKNNIALFMAYNDPDAQIDWLKKFMNRMPLVISLSLYLLNDFFSTMPSIGNDFVMVDTVMILKLLDLTPM